MDQPIVSMIHIAGLVKKNWLYQYILQQQPRMILIWQYVLLPQGRAYWSLQYTLPGDGAAYWMKSIVLHVALSKVWYIHIELAHSDSYYRCLCYFESQLPYVEKNSRCKGYDWRAKCNLYEALHSPIFSLSMYVCIKYPTHSQYHLVHNFERKQPISPPKEYLMYLSLQWNVPESLSCDVVPGESSNSLVS